MKDDDKLIFAKETSKEEPSNNLLGAKDDEPKSWKVLIIDDDEGVLQTTLRILRDFNFEGRGLKLFFGKSGKDAKKLIAEHPDMTIILLDVIMETDKAGLEVVRYIRENLGNNNVRIILRTGQAGLLNENEVFDRYDINDYLHKGELNMHRLNNSLKIAIRSFRMEEGIKKAMHREASLRKAADEANHAKSEFIANMSHELRSPLTSINSGLNIIEEVIKDPNADKDDWEDLLQGVHFAKNSVKRFLELLNNLLDLSKLKVGRMEFTFIKGNLKIIIKQAIEEISPQLQTKSLALITEFNGVDANIWMDSPKIMQVMINLLSNAVKFSDEGSEISIFLQNNKLAIGRRKSDNIMVPALDIIVKDQGIGVPDDEHKLIFDKFAQSSLTKDGSGGTGLGLSITQEIVQAHNGSIKVINNKEKGASFIVTLPINKITN